MTKYVVDASVATKWYFPEEHSHAAVLLLGDSYSLVAPELLLSELANTILKKLRRREAHLFGAMRPLVSTPLSVALKPVATIASLELGLRFGISAYDAHYVALALDEQCPVVTADRRLLAAVQPHLPEAISWIGDLATDDAT